jgi:putative phosphoesterase
MKIGVISDTHNFLDPKVAGLFAGVDHILHAGDIGLPSILLQLKAIAPVTAVGGNTDDPGLGYSENALAELGGKRFLIQHIVNPQQLDAGLKSRIAGERADVVVFGHTHKPFCQTIGSILFFNPGYAGKQRFDLPRSLAILHCEADGIRSKHMPL